MIIPGELPVRSSRIGRKYGWRRDTPDQRDLQYSLAHPHLGALPDKVDLRNKLGDCYDQGQLGSCTGNAIAAAIEFDLRKQPPAAHWTPSRLFIYYNERSIEGTINEDAGAEIRDGLKAVATKGAPPESEWPYVISRFALKPSETAYKHALQTRALRYYRVPQVLSQMRGCLAEGFPFVIGFTVYESFESHRVASDGVVPMPKSHERSLGGHAVLVVGYDDHTNRFLVRNSWGTQWGEKGHCFFPYAYLVCPQLAADFWTIRLVG
jgi:C1A family cysteine protease